MNNKKIAERIRKFGDKCGLLNDAQITKKADFYPDTIKNIEELKTAPRLDTLYKFADALNVALDDLIRDRTDADREMSRIWHDLSEYEKTETIVYAKMIIKEKNEKERQKAA